MEPRQSGAFALIVAGYVVAVAFLFFPWFSGRTRTSEFPVIPISEPALRGSASLVLIFLTIGFGLYLWRGHVGLLGSAAAIVFNASLLIWLFGASISTWLPTGVLPDTPIFAIEAGVSGALVGSLLLLAGITARLAEQTWNRRLNPANSWTFLISVAVASASLSSRGLPVLRAEAVGFEWSMASDAIPMLGDLLGITALTLAILALLLGTLRLRRLTIPLVFLAGLHLGLSLLVVVAGGLLEQAADVAAGRLDVDQVEVTAGYAGLVLSALAAAGAVAMALIARRRQRAEFEQRLLASSPFGEADSVPEAPDRSVPSGRLAALRNARGRRASKVVSSHDSLPPPPEF